MKHLTSRIEEVFMEIAFAEEREIRHITNGSGCFAEWLDDLFTAITFAEVGEFDEAQNIMGGGSRGSRNSVGYCLPGFCTGRA
ncbi:MAG: hypothetical protein ACYC69_00090 [Thermodesulfovibrionales bacterium]